MDQSFIPLVQDSFERVFRRKGELAERFYHHLFASVPEAQMLFRHDFIHQKEMFVTMLAATVRSMSSEESFDELGERLAMQHISSGVRPGQYQAAAGALTKAMKDVLGASLTVEEELAWQTAIARLTQKMTRIPPG